MFYSKLQTLRIPLKYRIAFIVYTLYTLKNYRCLPGVWDRVYAVLLMTVIRWNMLQKRLFLLLCVNRMHQNDNLGLLFFSSYDEDHLVVSNMLQLLNYMRRPRWGVAKVTRSSTASQARGLVKGVGVWWGGATTPPKLSLAPPSLLMRSLNLSTDGNFRRMHDQSELFTSVLPPKKYIYTLSPGFLTASYVPGTDAVLLHGATWTNKLRIPRKEKIRKFPKSKKNSQNL